MLIRSGQWQDGSDVRGLGAPRDSRQRLRKQGRGRGGRKTECDQTRWTGAQREVAKGVSGDSGGTQTTSEARAGSPRVVR